MDKNEIIATIRQAVTDLTELADAIESGEGRQNTLGFIVSELDAAETAIIDLELD